jgi:hypothetical protein
MPNIKKEGIWGAGKRMLNFRGYVRETKVEI